MFVRNVETASTSNTAELMNTIVGLQNEIAEEKTRK